MVTREWGIDQKQHAQNISKLSLAPHIAID